MTKTITAQPSSGTIVPPYEYDISDDCFALCEVSFIPCVCFIIGASVNYWFTNDGHCNSD
jgi:hypothetical protein